jgi:hypothetical protein
MDVTFSPLPLASRDSFTFMVEDFDLDGSVQHHNNKIASPARDTTVPSSPTAVNANGSLINSAGSLKMPVSIGRRNSFDWAANGSGRHRSLSFEFFNMDASSSSSGTMMSSHHPGGFASMMSPEDALLMAATPKGMSSLKRKHLPFTSFIGGGQNYSMSGLPGVEQQPLPKKQKLKKSKRGPKLKPDGSKAVKKKKPKSKSKRGPRKKSKKNSKSEPAEFFDPSIPRIGIYTLEQRAEKIKKWMEKARRRVWDKKIKYGCRKRLADARPRYKGRFVKSLPEEKLSIKKLDGDAAVTDPALRAAMEATRLWKLRQAAPPAAGTTAALGAPSAASSAMSAPAVAGGANTVANTGVSNMANPQTSTPPSTSSPKNNALKRSIGADSSGESTPRSPVTVTVTKQIPTTSSLSKQEKISFASEPNANVVFKPNAGAAGDV